MKNNPYIVLLQKYREFVPSKKRAMLFLAMQFCARMMMLFMPFTFGKVIDIAQKGGAAMWHDMLPYALVYLLIPIVERGFHGPSRVIENTLAIQSEKAYKLSLYHKAISLPTGWHTDNHSGEIIDQIEKASRALRSFAQDLFTYLGTYMSFLGAMIALMLLRPITVPIMICVGIIMIAAIKQFDKKIIPWIKEENKMANKVNALLFDYLSNIRTLITLRFLYPTEQSLSHRIDEVRAVYLKHMKRNERKRFFADVFLNLVTGGLLIVYIYNQWHLTGFVALGAMTMIGQYLSRMSSTFYNITANYETIMRYSANIAGVGHIDIDYSEMQKKLDMQNIAHSLEPARNAINISSLNFTYKEQAKEVQTLKDATIHLSRGQKIALVGESGSGKSTFLSLLRGLYDVDSVQVDIDGSKHDTMHVFADSTSLIPQEPEIFEDTMRFNITMGSDVSDDEVCRYSTMACFHDVAKRLVHSYDTSIKEKGVNLSGGQKQRLALARGLMAAHDSDILLLDESTSSVDSINEKKIYQNIWREYPQKTIVAAIHKLHLLPMFDVIYVFDQGKVIEHGSFDQLRTQGGTFATMWEQYTVDVSIDDGDENEENL